MSKRLTQHEFIEKANMQHNSKYDYTKVVYINNTTKIVIICPEHGEFTQSPAGHLTGFGCKHCAIVQRQNTMLDRYGVKHAKQSHTINEKTKRTMLDRYGVEYATQSAEILQKIKDSNLQTYGKEWAAASDSAIDKRMHTVRSKYGVDYVTQSLDVQNKIKETNIKIHGTACVLSSIKTQEKIKQTNIERYGTEYALSSSIIREKIQQTNIEKYNVSVVSQKHMVDVIPLLSDYDWLYEQYITKGRTSYSIAAELGIVFSTVCDYLRKVEIQVRASATGYSYKCIYWLESIMQEEGIYIQHALNEGEYRIPGTRFKADGYCAETNTIYEFHGDCFHGNPRIYNADEICSPFSTLTAGELYQKTLQREQLIRSLNYNLISVWASDIV